MLSKTRNPIAHMCHIAHMFQYSPHMCSIAHIARQVYELVNISNFCQNQKFTFDTLNVFYRGKILVYYSQRTFQAVFEHSTEITTFERESVLRWRLLKS